MNRTLANGCLALLVATATPVETAMAETIIIVGCAVGSYWNPFEGDCIEHANGWGGGGHGGSDNPVGGPVGGPIGVGGGGGSAPPAAEEPADEEDDFDDDYEPDECEAQYWDAARPEEVKVEFCIEIAPYSALGVAKHQCGGTDSILDCWDRFVDEYDELVEHCEWRFDNAFDRIVAELDSCRARMQEEAP